MQMEKVLNEFGLKPGDGGFNQNHAAQIVKQKINESNQIVDFFREMSLKKNNKKAKEAHEIK